MASPASFNVRRKRVREAVEMVSMEGELDLETAPEAQGRIADALAADGEPDLIIDLANLRFIDSTGLHMLLRASNDCQQRRRQMVVIGSGPQVKRIFELTDMAEFLCLVHGVDEAFAALT
jgi:anti-sigma B factor antagonist